MHFITLYFFGFGLGLLPALAFTVLCGSFTAITDVSREIAS